MGGLSAKSKKKKRQNAIKRIILKPVFDKVALDIAQNCELAARGINTMRVAPKNAFLHPEDPSAIFPQHQPEPILDVRVSAHPEAVVEYVERKLNNKLRKPDDKEFVRTAEEETELQMLEAMRGMQVDDERAEEEDMNELVNAMGRLQIHQKVRASRCKFPLIKTKRAKRAAVWLLRPPALLIGKRMPQSTTRRKAKLKNTSVSNYSFVLQLLFRLECHRGRRKEAY